MESWESWKQRKGTQLYSNNALFHSNYSASRAKHTNAAQIAGTLSSWSSFLSLACKCKTRKGRLSPNFLPSSPLLSACRGFVLAMIGVDVGGVCRREKTKEFFSSCYDWVSGFGFPRNPLYSRPGGKKLLRKLILAPNGCYLCTLLQHS